VPSVVFILDTSVCSYSLQFTLLTFGCCHN